MRARAAALLTLQKQRGLIIWISDLAETAMTPEAIEAAGQMRSRHLLLFVAIGSAGTKTAGTAESGVGVGHV